MEIYYTIIMFIFGLLFGSFFNVVGMRLPKEESLLHPGSHCPKCDHKLIWHELIPLLSFIIQLGKCRKCGCRISLFYPTTETLTGLLFALSYYLFGFTIDFAISILISSFLMIVVVSDISYLIIPDEVTIFFVILIILIKILCFNINEFIYSLVSGLLLFIVMYLIMLIGNKIFKKESLGGADIKLMFFVGLVIGPVEGLFALFLASVLALPISLILLYRKKSNILPFGPFILVSLLILFITRFEILEWLNYLKF